MRILSRDHCNVKNVAKIDLEVKRVDAIALLRILLLVLLCCRSSRMRWTR